MHVAKFTEDAFFNTVVIGCDLKEIIKRRGRPLIFAYKVPEKCKYSLIDDAKP